MRSAACGKTERAFPECSLIYSNVKEKVSRENSKCLCICIRARALFSALRYFASYVSARTPDGGFRGHADYKCKRKILGCSSEGIQFAGYERVFERF